MEEIVYFLTVHNEKINFACSICSLIFTDINKMSKHIENKLCDNNISIKLTDTLKNFDAENKKLENKVKSLNKIIVSKEKEILKLNYNLDIMDIKNNILTNIVDKYTDIDTIKIFEEKKKELHIYEVEDDIIPVYLHPKLKVVDKETTNRETTNRETTNRETTNRETTNRETINKEKTNRELVVNKQILDKEEVIIKKRKLKLKNKQNIVKKSKSSHRIIINKDYDNTDDDEEEESLNFYKNKMELLMSNIKVSKQYKKYLKDLFDIRINMLKYISVKDYENLIFSHKQILNNIFLNEKSYTYSKLKRLYNELLSPLDKRILRNGNYDQSLDPDFFRKVKYSMDNCNFSEKLIPFKSYYKNGMSYILAMFSIDVILEKFLVNKNCNNIIYIGENNVEDKYMFYTLKCINDSKKNWCMDSRLENLSIDISNSFYTYCIDLFKQLYYSCFDTYEYKFEYEKLIDNFYMELYQLIENIIKLHDSEKIRKILVNIISKNCYYTISENDHIDLKTSEPMQLINISKNIKDYKENNRIREIPKDIFIYTNDKIIEDFFSKF